MRIFNSLAECSRLINGSYVWDRAEEHVLKGFKRVSLLERVLLITYRPNNPHRVDGTLFYLWGFYGENIRRRKRDFVCVAREHIIK